MPGAKVARDSVDPKDFPDLKLTGRSLSLRWSDFVVRQSGGQRPIFAMNNATIVYLEAMTGQGPIVKIVFSGDPQGEFTPEGSLSVRILTRDKLNGVIDEWPIASWGDDQFCAPPKPQYTEDRQLGPTGNLNYFDEIASARMVVPAKLWISCPNVVP